MDEFDDYWARPLAIVAPRNRRGAGWSEVGIPDAAAWPELGGASGFVKRQEGYVCRPLWNGGRPTPTLRREVRFLEAARVAGLEVPAVRLYREAPLARALLLVDALAGPSLRDALATAGADVRQQVLAAVASTLVHLHRARIRHGALYDRHLIVTGPNRVALIDFEKARRAPTRSLAAIPDLARFFRRTPALTAAERDRLVSAYRVLEFPLLALWWRLTR